MHKYVAKAFPNKSKLIQTRSPEISVSVK